MNRLLILGGLILGLLLPGTSRAQSVPDYAVQVSAKVNKATLEVKLKWPTTPTSNNYAVFRKTKKAIIWGKPLASLPGKASGYIDKIDSIGKGYEYQIIRTDSVNKLYGYGYIYTGIELPAVENRGKLLLLVDDSFTTSLTLEIKRLEDDLIGDGWRVIRQSIKRTAKVSAAKTLIDNIITNHPDLESIFLLGHIPVPYSGFIGIDAHPDHQGAWPADAYYGDNSPFWSENSSKYDTLLPRKENWNKPNDGKFDNDLVPGEVLFQMGRVDLSQMSAFGLSETNLMRRYLDKDHAYRQRAFAAAEKSVLDDNFGTMGGEAFAASGYKAFAPMFGDSNIEVADYIESTRKGSYLCGYGCGGGTYTSAIGIGTTDSFVADSIHSVFNMLFGSYFGDWDVANNFLRAPLAAKGWGLTSVWSGRPHYILHHMAMGEPIGYDIRLDMSDKDIYYRYPDNRYNILRNNCLMGDPSLRLHTVSPPRNLKISIIDDNTRLNSKISLKWSAAKQNIIGYHIYRRPNLSALWQRISTTPVTDTMFTDSTQPKGNNLYMVRSFVLQTSASGTYFNQSQGIMDSAKSLYSVVVNTPQRVAISYRISPNPVTSTARLRLPEGMQGDYIFSLKDITGRTVFTQTLHPNGEPLVEIISLENLPTGVYLGELNGEGSMLVKKIVKE